MGSAIGSRSDKTIVGTYDKAGKYTNGDPTIVGTYDPVTKVYTPPKPPTPPPLPPDATDELVRKARLAARNRELMARGRKSTFSSGTAPVPTILGG